MNIKTQIDKPHVMIKKLTLLSLLTFASITAAYAPEPVRSTVGTHQ